MVVSINKEKSHMLAKMMFPPKLVDCSPPDDDYKDQLPPLCDITKNPIHRNIARLSPYKAPGPDGIPNVMLKWSADIIMPYLIQIFRAALKLGVYAEQWREITPCVLRKPGKPRYDIPKAYWLVALVNTVAKLLSLLRRTLCT